MKTSNAIRLWGFTLFVMTLCLLALLIQDNVGATVTVQVPVVKTTTSTTSTTMSPVVSTTTTIPSSTEVFLECIRWRESRGNYKSVNSTGTFMGAYQFYQEGWDTFAARIGRHDLVGVQPHAAAPADQDAVALSAHRELGSKPWNGACD